MKPHFRPTLIALAVSATLGLSACVDGGDSTTSASGDGEVVTTGVITGFGSVFVNGVEFETNGAQIVVDGVPLDESHLKVGMVVTLEGSVNADGSTGQALAIRFADEVEGIVQQNDVAASNTLTIMGQTVHVDVDTVFESFDQTQLGPADIQPGNIVEVSGFADGQGNIYATRIEVKKAQKDPDDEIELKGLVKNLDTSATTFQIGNQTIDYSAANLDFTLKDGQVVEVKSRDGFDGNGTLLASEIELEDEDGKRLEAEAGAELEIEGVITALVDPQNGRIEVNGQPVQLALDDTGLDLTNLQAGMRIKVEGRVDENGVLVVEELKRKPKAELEIAAQVEAVDVAAGTLTLLGQTIRVTPETIKKDESQRGERYFDLADLAQGDWLELKLAQDENGALVAIKLEREDAEPDATPKIEGKIDQVGNGTIEVGGIPLDLGALSNPPSLMAGDEVEMTVSLSSDGTIMVQTMELDD